MAGCKKKTTEQYITEVTAIHNGLYSYDKLVYRGAYQKQEVIVTCPIHGDFTIYAVEHRRGKGCQKCSLIRRAKSHDHTFDDFLKIAEPLHNYKYKYKVPEKYLGQKTKIDIECSTHGWFTTSAVEHKSGRGCGKCGLEAGWLKMLDTQEEFIEKAKAVHGETYDYSLVEYKNSLEDVEIICKVHKQSFWQMPQNHKSGSGCPACAQAGYDRTKPASLYILVAGNITKVGITNRTASHRLVRINKTSGLGFTVHTEIRSTNGLKICNLESETLRWLRANYSGVGLKFDGSTECFVDVSADTVLDFILPRTGELN